MIWELKFIESLQAGASSFAINFWSFISFFGEELIMIAVIGFVYWCYNKKFGESLAYTVLTSMTLNGILKNIIVRDRPYLRDGYNIKDLKSLADTSYSFPSGHSQASATFFTAIAINMKPTTAAEPLEKFFSKVCQWLKRWWPLLVAVIIPLMVAFSRIFLGMHFPTDVFAGLAIGVAMAFLCSFLYNRIKNKYILFGITILVLCCGLFFANTKDYFVSFGMLFGCMAGIIFENNVVNFDYNVAWWKKLIRFIGGIALIMGIRFGLGALFGLISDDESTLTYVLDMLRYAIMTFSAMGLYPLLFKACKF